MDRFVDILLIRLQDLVNLTRINSRASIAALGGGLYDGGYA